MTTENVAGGLIIQSVDYLDLDGDNDAYPDTGETGRHVLTVVNFAYGADSDVTIRLTSNDPDVACITDSYIKLDSMPSNTPIVLGSFDPLQPGFTFTTSNMLQTPPSPGAPARLDFCLELTHMYRYANVGVPTCFSLFADVDLPPGVTQTFTLGPDGLPGTADDGTVREGFDLDRDGDGDFTVGDTFLRTTAPGVYRGTCSNAPETFCVDAGDCPAGNPAPVCYSGFYLSGSEDGTVANTVAGVPCGVSISRRVIRPASSIPTIRWTGICTAPPGATDCPNLESGACVGGCTYDTPLDGAKAISLPNALHMGAHFSNTRENDSTHFRSIQGFVSAPLNLTIDPRPGDLEMSFHHIARLMDNRGCCGGFNGQQCKDCGDVQYQLDVNPDPLVDEWGVWDKLVPFENIYDHKALAWSALNSYYCRFTPADAGDLPPNPNGARELMCVAQGAWSSCGSVTGTTIVDTADCAGPGVLDASGTGVWVKTRFDLSGFLGQRMRIRWIGSTWTWSETGSSYYELGTSWDTTPQDDGWSLDDIVVSGTVESQMTPIPDTAVRAGACPIDFCDESIADAGTDVIIQPEDLYGNPLDLVTEAVPAGDYIRLNLFGSTLPGGCVNGAPEYSFILNGTPYGFGPTSFGLFGGIYTRATLHLRFLARCSSDHACTSQIGAEILVPVFSADGNDSFFGTRSSPPVESAGILYDRATGTTTLNWWAPGTQDVDLYRGAIGPGISRGTLNGQFYDLDTTPGPASCLLANVIGTPTSTGRNGTSGPLDQAADPDPALGFATYYLVSRNDADDSSLNALGCVSPGVCADDPAAYCSDDGDCATAVCIEITGSYLGDGPMTGPLGCPLPTWQHAKKVVRRVVPAEVCP